ncbi:hypothetical protein [Pseudomonas putida]|uniref:hypothetical protein n=1 Tax=Pseudomonas putida TaxID=303 RepID=UPI0037C8AF18
MSNIVQITQKRVKKAKIIFEFDIDSKTYIHNELSPMRSGLLNTMGDKLAIADLDYHYSTIYDLEQWLANFVYIPLTSTDTATIIKFKKRAIRALDKIIKTNKEHTDSVRKGITNLRHTNDFDFDDSAYSTPEHNEEVSVPTDDFNFDELDIDDEIDFGIKTKQHTDEPEAKDNDDELDAEIAKHLIDGAKGLEIFFTALAGLCRVVGEQCVNKDSK